MFYVKNCINYDEFEKKNKKLKKFQKLKLKNRHLNDFERY